MKTTKNDFALSTLTLAVQGALLAMLAMPVVSLADDAEVAALTQPTNSVDIGAEYVSKDSAKFGEYNGLNKSGAYLIGNINMRGGDAYNAFNGGSGIRRWEFKGSDIGTTSRELSGNVSDQGKWSVGVGYDELRHNISNSYNTPFQGGMGGNNFFLPDTFNVIDVNSTMTATPGTQGITAGQLASFNQVDVYSNRKNASFNVGYTIDSQWSVQFDFNRLKQSGAKLMGVATDSTGGSAGENNVTLMNPTNYKTDTFDLALNWIGDKGHITGSYSASIFEDGYNSLSWSNPFVDSTVVDLAGNPIPSASTTGSPLGAAFPVNMFATMPSNDLHQLNLLGGYDFSKDTILAGGLSYGRNKQNSAFINDPLLASALPQASLNGLVVNTHADLKLTNQTTKNLTLSGGLKYDNSDSRTASNTYASFNSIAGDTWGAVVNTPMSYRKMLLELDGNYRIDKKQSVRLGYSHEKVKRWCNNALANNAQSSDINDTTLGTGTGDPALLQYNANHTCVMSPESNENKLSANYKLKAGDDVMFKAGYAYAKRSAAVSTFYNPMQTSLDGFENQGFMAFFDASRTEQMLKAGVDWQPSDRVSMGVSGRYVDDKYDASLGVQKSHTWSLNLDTSYDYSRDGVVSAYLSLQRRQRDMLSSADHVPLAASTNLWTNQLTDDSDTLGISAKQKGLLGGKFELAGNLSYSLGKTGYSTQTTNCDPLVCGDPAVASGALPVIRNEILKLRVTGSYHVDKASRVVLGYRFQKQKNNDYFYSAYQTGYTDVGVLPTNQLGPNYTVNVVSATYIINF